MSGFRLDERLRDDTIPAAESDLALLRWMNDRRYPWLVWIPKRAGVVELHDLADDDLVAFARESAAVSRALAIAFDAHKINVAALGNVVRSLHVHHVVRFPEDPAWPGPVFGHSPPSPYGPGELARRHERIAAVGLGSAFRLDDPR